MEVHSGRNLTTTHRQSHLPPHTLTHHHNRHLSSLSIPPMLRSIVSAMKICACVLDDGIQHSAPAFIFGRWSVGQRVADFFPTNEIWVGNHAGRHGTTRGSKSNRKSLRLQRSGSRHSAVTRKHRPSASHASSMCLLNTSTMCSAIGDTNIVFELQMKYVLKVNVAWR